MKRWARRLGALAILVLAWGVVRALTLPDRQPFLQDLGPPPALREAAPLAGRLAAALRFATVSYQDAARDDEAVFAAYETFLRESYPLVHEQLARESVSTRSALYTWRGHGPEHDEPILLLAHHDVVPAQPGLEEWPHEPFSGAIDGGFVWGRGALDDKGSQIAILEAVEELLREGWIPERTLLLAFGGDEEVGGSGARAIAAVLEQRGVQPFLILDEGSFLLDGLVPGVAGPVAMINVAEKGSCTIELRARGASGHSSIPPRSTAIGRLARAIERLESRPMPLELDGPAGATFAWLAPEMPFVQRFVFANSWLTAPLLRSALAGSDGPRALLHTTTAVTMIRGGTKENVLPGDAVATVNFRILPGDTVSGVLAHIRAAVDDPEIEIVLREGAAEPSSVSPAAGPAWELLAATVKRCFPDAVVAPGLTVGTTDARHYTGLTEHVYRFLPFVLGPADVARVHGGAERAPIEDLARAERFYRALVRAACGSSPGPF